MTERADLQRLGALSGARVAAVVVLATALVVGTHPAPAGADVVTASNTTPIAVPAAGSANGQGAASPYPSGISVSGMTGTVSDVNITLTNVVHPIATDIDVLLVGPAGQNLLVMSDVKGDSGFSANGTVTFDDQAAAQIPATGVPGTGP